MIKKIDFSKVKTSSSCGGSEDCGSFDCTAHRPMKQEVRDALDEIENQVYGINARNISMHWIGLRKTPTPKEISELNKLLSFIILEIRTLKETGKMDKDALHKKEFPELYEK